MHQYTIAPDADVALVAATAKTVLQLATPSTRRAKIKEITVSFKGVTSSDVPVLIRLQRQTTAGTATSTTPVPEDGVDPAALCSASYNASAEPTSASEVPVKQWMLTPTGGTLVYQLPLGDEPALAVSTRFGLIMTAPQAQNCRVGVTFQE